jgi:hypothetical protein
LEYFDAFPQCNGNRIWSFAYTIVRNWPEFNQSMTPTRHMTSHRRNDWFFLVELNAVLIYWSILPILVIIHIKCDHKKRSTVEIACHFFITNVFIFCFNAPLHEVSKQNTLILLGKLSKLFVFELIRKAKEGTCMQRRTSRRLHTLDDGIYIV